MSWWHRLEQVRERIPDPNSAETAPWRQRGYRVVPGTHPGRGVRTGTAWRQRGSRTVHSERTGTGGSALLRCEQKSLLRREHAWEGTPPASQRCVWAGLGERVTERFLSCC